jgi:hypothetical protein
MIQGVITTKDVLLHGRLIASEFGFVHAPLTAPGREAAEEQGCDDHAG